MMKRLSKLLFIVIAFQLNADNIDRLEEYLQKYHQENPHPGFSIVMVQDDQIVLKEGYGVIEAGGDQRHLVSTVNQLGSVTKSMTAIAVMQLEEQGLLNLDTPVVEYLPSFTTANREMSDLITIRMLLNHSSGLSANPAVGFRQFSSLTKGLEAVLSSLQSEVLPRRPGTAYLYSNTGYAIAGLVISRVSGIDYEQYMKQYIFNPLEMDNTSTDPDVLALLESNFGNGWAPEGEIFSLKHAALQGGGIEPAGSRLRSSADDLANYIIMLMNGGKFREKTIISEKSLQEIFTEQIAFPGLSREIGGQSETVHYGLGWEIAPIDGRLIQFHTGGTGTFSSVLMISPKEDAAVAIMANTGGLNPYKYITLTTLANNLLHLLAGEELSKYGIPVIPAPLRSGSYYIPGNKEIYTGTYTITPESADSLAPKQIVIEEEDHRLRGSLITDQEFARFTLDFISPVSALAGSIGPDYSLDFEYSIQGNIISLSCFGANYIKVNHREKGFQRINWNNIDYSFLLPVDWSYQIGDKILTAADKKDDQNRFTAGIAESREELERIIQAGESIEISTYEKQIIGPDYYSQVFSRVMFDDSLRQQLILYTQKNGKYLYFILTTADGKLTVSAQEMLRPLLHSLTPL